MMTRAIKFGGASTHRLSAPAATSINNLDPLTVWFWGRFDSLASVKGIFVKGAVGANRRMLLDNTGAFNNIRVQVDTTGGTGMLYITNTQCIVAGKPFFVAWTYSFSATPQSHIYVGDLLTPATEQTYGTSTDGNGGNPDDSGGPLMWGNNAAASQSMPGVGWVGGYCAGILPLDVIRLQQALCAPLPGITRALHVFGANGAGTVPDLSGNGNHASITGAVPVGQCLPRMQPRVRGELAVGIDTRPFRLFRGNGRRVWQAVA